MNFNRINIINVEEYSYKGHKFKDFLKFKKSSMSALHWYKISTIGPCFNQPIFSITTFVCDQNFLHLLYGLYKKKKRDNHS